MRYAGHPNPGWASRVRGIGKTSPQPVAMRSLRNNAVVRRVGVGVARRSA